MSRGAKTQQHSNTITQTRTHTDTEHANTHAHAHACTHCVRNSVPRSTLTGASVLASLANLIAYLRLKNNVHPSVATTCSRQHAVHITEGTFGVTLLIVSSIELRSVVSLYGVLCVVWCRVFVSCVWVLAVAACHNNDCNRIPLVPFTPPQSTTQNLKDDERVQHLQTTS